MRWRLGWVLALGLALATGYRPVTVVEVAKGRVPPGRVRVFGRYLAFLPTTRAVKGVLAGARYAVPLAGEVFDRRPEPGRYLEVWGELLRTPDGPQLRFHNFRYPGEDRRPRPADLPRGSGRVWLWVYAPGGEGEVPAAVSEDRRSFRLPGYTGPFGLVCLVVRRLGPGVLEARAVCGGEEK